MRNKTVYIIRGCGLIYGYVNTHEEATLICQQKNKEYNLNEQSPLNKWSFMPVYYMPGMRKRGVKNEPVR